MAVETHDNTDKGSGGWIPENNNRQHNKDIRVVLRWRLRGRN